MQAATTMEMVTGEEVKLPGRKKRRTWHLLPTSKANRVRCWGRMGAGGWLLAGRPD